MCGIAGFLENGPLEDNAVGTLHDMTTAIAHRGPDDAGHWLEAEQGVALGHRRLAILDLSPAGHQPMISASGRFVLVYNGEIYNHHQLRRELEQNGLAPAWRGHSDTEVLLACIDSWGVRTALEKSNGMFAMAVWDKKLGRLTLARDRAGEKPLYYGYQNGTFLFGSELKAIAAHPAFEGIVDRQSVSSFMQFGYVPAPRSIWAGIAKLPPAHLLEIQHGDDSSKEPTCYWNFGKIATDAAASPFDDTRHLIDDLQSLLLDSVKIRMEADVPLGAFLSGGIDSSLITALMQAQVSRPIKTFTIGFAEKGYDESGYASDVAQHLGTDHHNLHVSSAQAQDILPRISDIWDEPFADASQIPTFLVNALARQEVTVALSGDGGDELFAGYNRHVVGARIWKSAAKWPFAARSMAAAVLASPLAGNTAQGLRNISGQGSQIAGLAERLPKIGAIIGSKNTDDFYNRLVSQWPNGQSPVLQSQNIGQSVAAPAFADFRNTMLYLDTMTYLPDDILAKVDRAGMAVSLEGRIPFLDHRVIEFAWRVPLSAKIQKGVGKHILRQLLYRHVPRSLIDRPKAGFAVPVGDWLVGGLRDWAEMLLHPATIRSQGFLDADMVQSTWHRFQRGEKALFPRLWCVLMFQAWLQHNSGLIR